MIINQFIEPFIHPIHYLSLMINSFHQVCKILTILTLSSNKDYYYCSVMKQCELKSSFIFRFYNTAIYFFNNKWDNKLINDCVFCKCISIKRGVFTLLFPSILCLCLFQLPFYYAYFSFLTRFLFVAYKQLCLFQKYN